MRLQASGETHASLEIAHDHRQPTVSTQSDLEKFSDLIGRHRDRGLGRCQSARKTDPVSASNFDPPCAVEIRA